MFFRIKITIEYDGTPYCGWQKQKDLLIPSIQSEIELALNQIFQREILVFVAGRTDRGVHASGQVAHFDLYDFEIEKFAQNNCLSNLEIKIINAINNFLNHKQISILDLEIFNLKDEIKKLENGGPEAFQKILTQYASNYENENFDFHARFSAKEKTYIYKILNRKQPSGLYSNYFWHISYELPLLHDLEEIASILIGEHDFSSFRSKFCQSPKTMRHLDEIKVTIIKGSLKPFENEIHFKIKAKSFLHNQVRLMVGTLMFFARSKISKDNAKQLLKKILESKNRSFAKEKAPAHGLYLAEVRY